MRTFEWIVWSLAVLGLIVLLVNGYVMGLPLPSLNAIKENPQQFVGREVEYYGTTSHHTAEGFLFSTGEQSIQVLAPNTRETIFGYTSFKGIVLADGRIQASEIWYHDYSWNLFIPSIIGGILFIVLFFSEWRIRKWRFVRCRIG